MSYLPVEQGYAEHREVRRLGRLLAAAPPSPDAQAMGHLLAARLWSIDNCGPDGSLPVADGWILEQAAQWRGPDGELIAAFVEVGFLRREGDLLYFPDWSEHQGRVLDARRVAREKKQRQRIRGRSKVPSTWESTGESTGDTPGESRCKGHDKDIDKDIDEKTGPGPVGQSFAAEEQDGAVASAAAVLLQFPAWDVSGTETSQLLAELAYQYPGVDLLHEVNAWRGQVLDKGKPQSCKGALRGWMKNARPADNGKSKDGEWDSDIHSLAETLAESMDMDQTLAGKVSRE